MRTNGFQEYAKYTFFCNFYRNLVGSWQVCGWLLRRNRSSQPANRQLANQFSIKTELKPENSYFRANLPQLSKVLLIAYYFPPMATVGTVRNRNIAYWYQQSFSTVTVLTTRFPPLLSLDEVDLSGFNIHRVWNLDYRHIITFINWLTFFWKKTPTSNSTKALGTTFSKYNRIPFFRKILDSFPTNVLIGEGGFVYIYLGILKGIYLVKKNNITHLHSSYRPYSDHIIAYWLKILFPKLVWVADFRDVDIHKEGMYAYRFQCWCIKTLLKKANIVTTISEGLKKMLSPYHSNIYVLRNGIEGVLLEKTSFSTKKSDFFTLTYTGSLYAGLHDVYPFFQTLRHLIDEKKIDQTSLKIIYAGKDSQLYRTWLTECGVENYLDDKGLILRSAAQQLQTESQINLLFTWCLPDYEGMLSSKIYEYFAANRPVLVYIKGNPDLEMEALFQSVGAGKVTYNQEDIESYLLECYQAWQQTGCVPSPIKQVALEQYSWESQMTRFITTLFPK